MDWSVEITAADFEVDDPCLALRRQTDRCFFRVEEVLPMPPKLGATGGDESPNPIEVRGFIVEGVMIDADEVAELRRTDANGGLLPACKK